MGFSRQEYWSGLPFTTPGDLPNPGIKTKSPTLQAETGLLIEYERANPNCYLLRRKNKKVTNSLVKEPVRFNNPFRNKNFKSSLIRGH